MGSFRILLHRQQLIERVELQKRKAGVSKNFCLRHDPERFLHHAVGALVAIGYGFKNNLVSAHNAEVHTPRVDADRLDAHAALRDHANGGFHLAEQALHFPFQNAAHANRLIRKTIHLFQLQLLFAVRRVSAQHAKNCPAAGRAEVKAQIVPDIVQHFLPSSHYAPIFYSISDIARFVTHSIKSSYMTKVVVRT